MLEKSQSPAFEDEVFVRNLIEFFMGSWKTFVFTIVLGMFGSAAYLWLTPNQYQAVAQIQMAQLSISNSNSNSNSNSFGVSIEDPSLLLARLKLPTSYLAKEIKECGFEDSKYPSEDLAKALEFSVVKGVGSLIELKINRDSKDLAISCAQSLFERIKISQNEIIKPFIEEAKNLLPQYHDRLNNARSLVYLADKSGVASAAYLVNRDEVRFLNEEILRLNTFIASADLRQAKLVSPIYASDIPAFPNINKSLIAGVFVGVFLRFFIGNW